MLFAKKVERAFGVKLLPAPVIIRLEFVPHDIYANDFYTGQRVAVFRDPHRQKLYLTFDDGSDQRLDGNHSWRHLTIYPEYLMFRGQGAHHSRHTCLIDMQEFVAYRFHRECVFDIGNPQGGRRYRDWNKSPSVSW